MKTLLLIVALSLVEISFGQYKIDNYIKSEFDSLFKRQPKEIQKKRYLKGFNEGFTLILSFKQDTLNIADFTPLIIDTSLKMVLKDPDTGEELPASPKDTAKYNQWLSCQAIYSKDTLYIGSSFGLFSAIGFSLKVIGDKSAGNFFEAAGRQDIYRYKLSDPKSTIIDVKANAENVILSGIPTKLGDLIYGKATLITEPFYRDDREFKNNYIHIRYTITYLFTGKLIDGEENSSEPVGR